MRLTYTAALAAAAAVLSLAACTPEDTISATPPATASAEPAQPSPSESQLSAEDRKKAREAAGIPEDPTGQARTDYLAALRAINPALVEDPEDAIDNGVNQCSGVKSEKAIWLAQQRFGTSDHEVTEAEAKQINEAVRKYICPDH